ncbi:EpsG family protein [Photobacterium carnosum]|uniref:EpsG family protein n=1 Tax=Photobacterium carnosum TaxID=2023717 RepID=UPI001E2F8709|nr:EpsG family protein [Photobacterium carnosum]MCD9539146.1 hypothetical protein [Photobacterium carnosum]MCF2163634.1 hypothetical protein [Photobacterium carnosum]
MYRIKDVLNILLGFLCILPLYTTLNYDQDLNPDILNYMYDYIYNYGYYEIGYQYIVLFFRDLLGFNFQSYWNSLLIIEVILLFLLYKRFSVIIIAYMTLLIMSQGILGTQVRYTLSILIFLLSIDFFYDNKKILYTGFLLSFLLHIGSGFIIIIFLCSRKISMSALSKHKYFFCFLCLVIIFFSKVVVLYAMQYTRFIYFDKGSVFLQSRSVISIIYMFISAIFIYKGIVINKCFENNVIIKLSLFLLIISLLCSSIAVLSARIFVVYMLIIPLVTYYFIYNSKTRILGLGLLSLSIVNLIVYFL